MQLGMIGLGRMGANMVRRLHEGRAQRASSTIAIAEAVQELAKEGATAADVARRFRRQARTAARRLADGAGRGRRKHRQRSGRAAWPRTTSSSTAATRTTSTTSAARSALRAKGIHYVDVGTSRRRLGPRARLLHDDRRARRRPWRGSIRSSRRSRPVVGTIDRTPGREKLAARPSRAICTAVRRQPATSSRWSTTASSTASWPPTPRA